MPRTPVFFGQMSQCRGKIKTREMSRFVSEISDVYKPHGVTTICFRMFSRMIIVEHEAFCNAVRVAKLASKLNLASWHPGKNPILYTPENKPWNLKKGPKRKRKKHGTLYKPPILGVQSVTFRGCMLLIKDLRQNDCAGSWRSFFRLNETGTYIYI